MGKNSGKYFSVNMSTEEPTKTNDQQENTSKIKTNNTSNMSSSLTSTPDDSSKRRIKFNQNDLAKAHNNLYNTQTVRRIENPEEMLIGNDEKVRPKDIKTVLIPAIVLIIICILNIVFLAPYVLDFVISYVLHGELVTLKISAMLSNDELLAIAGLTAVVSYCIFSISLLVFSIYNIFKLVYIKRDLVQIGTKILLYAFLIGFFIGAVDTFISFNITEIIVKITTFGLHSMTPYLA